MKKDKIMIYFVALISLIILVTIILAFVLTYKNNTSNISNSQVSSSFPTDGEGYPLTDKFTVNGKVYSLKNMNGQVSDIDIKLEKTKDVIIEFPEVSCQVEWFCINDESLDSFTKSRHTTPASTTTIRTGNSNELQVFTMRKPDNRKTLVFALKNKDSANEDDKIYHELKVHLVP